MDLILVIAQKGMIIGTCVVAPGQVYKIAPYYLAEFKKGLFVKYDEDRDGAITGNVKTIEKPVPKPTGAAKVQSQASTDVMASIEAMQKRIQTLEDRFDEATKRAAKRAKKDGE